MPTTPAACSAVPSQSVALRVAVCAGRRPSRNFGRTASGCTASPTCPRSRDSLDELAARSDEKGGPLVLKLPRMPGSREARWVICCGERPSCRWQVRAAMRAPAADAHRDQAMRNEHAALRAEMAELRGIVDRLCDELGVRRGMRRGA
jgi:hypothetical protein